jgi:hypothetical protein
VSHLGWDIVITWFAIVSIPFLISSFGVFVISKIRGKTFKPQLLIYHFAISQFNVLIGIWLIVITDNLLFLLSILSFISGYYIWNHFNSKKVIEFYWIPSILSLILAALSLLILGLGIIEGNNNFSEMIFSVLILVGYIVCFSMILLVKNISLDNSYFIENSHPGFYEQSIMFQVVFGFIAAINYLVIYWLFEGY